MAKSTLGARLTPRPTSRYSISTLDMRVLATTFGDPDGAREAARTSRRAVAALTNDEEPRAPDSDMRRRP